MDITPTVSPSLKLIQSYARDKFMLGNIAYPHDILVRGESVEPLQFDFTGYEDLLGSPQIGGLAGSIDVLLIGVGAEFKPLSWQDRQKLRQLGFTVDAMDTGAACRTYNIMAMEGRLVAAILLLPKTPLAVLPLSHGD